MNIEEYRALKAQEAESVTPTEQPQEPVVETPVVPETPVVEPESTPEPTPQPDTKPSKLVIDGIGEVTPEEINEWRRGYLRNDDYTRKTQAISQRNRELEELERELKSRPIQTQIPVQPVPTTPETPEASRQEPAYKLFETYEPFVRKVSDLENKYTDLIVEREIEQLSNRYSDFDAREVLGVATDKRIGLEDAYLLLKAKQGLSTAKEEVDVESIKEAIRKEIIAELEQEKESTHTIISPNDAPAIITDNTPKLTTAEREFIQKSGMTEEEFIKWKPQRRRKGKSRS